MYLKKNLWSPSGEGVILRILSFEHDSSVIYSWKPCHDNFSSATTFIRHYNPKSDKDRVLLICNTSAEIISASLSVDHRVISFTIWVASEIIASGKPYFELITKDSRKFSQYQSDELHDAHPIKSHFMMSSHSFDVTNKNAATNSSSPYQKPYHRGVYKSYLAQVWPTVWTMKFTANGKLLQRTAFTNYLKHKADGDINLSQYKVILIMHKESIVVYNLSLKNTLVSNSRTSNKPHCDGACYQQSSIYGKPSLELVTKNSIWCQWDASSQRLYYISTSTTDKKSTTYYQLVCFQFFDKMPRHKVLEIEVDLGLSRYTVLNKKPSSVYYDLDPTVSSIDLNVRLCLFKETGSMCLCWQELPSSDVTPEWTYSIAILNKDIVVRHRYRHGASSFPVTFAPIGRNLLVHQPGGYVHLYDIEAMCCDQVRMSNGLYHMYLPEDHFLEFDASRLEYIDSYVKLDEIFQLNDIDSSGSSASSSCGDNDSVYFDKTSMSFVSFHFDSEQMKKLLSSKTLTIQNKIFLTRQAVFSCRGYHASPEALVEISELIMRDPTDSSVTGILSQLLIANANKEISNPRYNIPLALMSLFPLAVPTGALHQMISLKDQHSNGGNYVYLNSRLRIESQLEEYVGRVSTRHKAQNSSQTSHDAPHHDAHDVIVHGIKESLWFRTLSACKSGSFSEYDLESIQEELKILRDSHLSGSRGATLLHHRLPKIFEKNFMKNKEDAMSSGDGIQNIGQHFTRGCLSIANSDERDNNSENIMALTSEKLCDHLLAHCKVDANQDTATLDLAQISHDYACAQVKASQHTLTMLLMDVENPDRPLYSPATTTEQNLLFTLNQFQLVCHISCFPLPNGFHTLIARLTFCCLLARHTYVSEDEDGNVIHELDVDFLKEQFFDHVDKGLIRLTEYFMQIILQELGDKEIFSSIVDEVMKRVISRSEDSLSTLLKWRHHKTESHFVKDCLMKHYLSQDGGRRTKSASFSVSKKFYSSVALI